MVVERFYLCLEANGFLGCGFPEWVEAGLTNSAWSSRGKASAPRDKC